MAALVADKPAAIVTLSTWSRFWESGYSQFGLRSAMAGECTRAGNLVGLGRREVEPLLADYGQAALLFLAEVAQLVSKREVELP